MEGASALTSSPWPRFFARADRHSIGGRVPVSLIPTFKTATADTWRRNLVALVIANVGLPDVLVWDRGSRFASAFWTVKGLHAAPSRYFSPPKSPSSRGQGHHNTTSEVERVDGIIVDTSLPASAPTAGRPSCRRSSSRSATPGRQGLSGHRDSVLRLPRPAPPQPACPLCHTLPRETRRGRGHPNGARNGGGAGDAA